jgi:hypothetical protein
MPGEPGTRTQTFRTLNPPERDWSQSGVVWKPPSYTESTRTSRPLTGAEMAPTFAQNAPYTGPRASDVYNPQSDIMQDINNPMGYPTPSPTPTPPPKRGFDFFKSLFGLA